MKIKQKEISTDCDDLDFLVFLQQLVNFCVWCLEIYLFFYTSVIDVISSEADAVICK